MAAVEIVNSANGLHLTEIAKQMDRSVLYVKVLLLAAKQYGHIGLVRASMNSVWVPLHLQEPMQKAHDEAAELRKRRDDIRRAENRRLRRAGKMPLAKQKRNAQETETDETPIQRWEKSNRPLPFECKAPASVFHLGGML